VESNHYFPPFAESRITWIEPAQPKMSIIAFCEKILDGRVARVQDLSMECDNRVSKKILARSR
jgi:hypothetical protein